MPEERIDDIGEGVRDWFSDNVPSREDVLGWVAVWFVGGVLAFTTGVVELIGGILGEIEAVLEAILDIAWRIGEILGVGPAYVIGLMSEILFIDELGIFGLVISWLILIGAATLLSTLAVRLYRLLPLT